MFGLIRTELTPASLRALSAWEPVACQLGDSKPSHVPAVVYCNDLRRTRVIKLSCLTNTETTTADNQNLLHINQVLASSYKSAFEVGFRVWRDLTLVVPQLCSSIKSLPGPCSWSNWSRNSTRHKCTSMSNCGSNLLPWSEEIARE